MGSPCNNRGILGGVWANKVTATKSAYVRQGVPMPHWPLSASIVSFILSDKKPIHYTYSMGFRLFANMLNPANVLSLTMEGMSMELLQEADIIQFKTSKCVKSPCSLLMITILLQIISWKLLISWTLMKTSLM
jgi:hypothetical protein